MFKLLVLSFITHERVLTLVKMQARKVTLLHGSFPPFLNCTNGTKSHKASQSIAKARSSHQRCSLACNFIKKEILAQVFSYEFCEISKNTFLTEHLWMTASKKL